MFELICTAGLIIVVAVTLWRFLEPTRVVEREEWKISPSSLSWVGREERKDRER